MNLRRLPGIVFCLFVIPPSISTLAQEVDTAQEASANEDVNAPDPQALAKNWWSWFEDAGDRLPDRISRFKARLNSLADAAALPRTETHQLIIDEIRQGLDQYAVLRQREPPVTLIGLIRILVILALAWWLSKIVRHGLDRVANRSNVMNRASVYTVSRPAAVEAAYTWAIETALRKYDIQIPFLQRDLHLRGGFAQALSQSTLEQQTVNGGDAMEMT